MVSGNTIVQLNMESDMNQELKLRLDGRQIRNVMMSAALLGLVIAPGLALAGAPGGTDAAGRVTSFFTNINSLLNIASIAIVTIAIIFAGYQIAFNHKRIGDVAPVLIGGFLIGAAAQIARMLLPDNDVGSIGGMAQLGELALKLV